MTVLVRTAHPTLFFGTQVRMTSILTLNYSSVCHVHHFLKI